MTAALVIFGVALIVVWVRVLKLEGRVDSLEDWAEMEHNFITLECDMDGDDDGEGE